MHITLLSAGVIVCVYLVTLAKSQSITNTTTTTTTTTPLYECQTNVIDEILLISTDGKTKYNKNVAPLSKVGAAVDVYTSIHVSNYSISNYGVDGGSIEIDGIFTSSWNDKRLQWNPNAVGECTEIQLHASYDLEKSDIWTPFRSSTVKISKDDVGDGDNNNNIIVSSHNTIATISSNGNVAWKRRLKLDFPCRQIWEEDSKICSYTMSNKDDVASLLDRNHVNYIVGDVFNSTGISVEDMYSIPGYEVNKTHTSMNILLDDEQAVSMNNEIIFSFKLDPLEKTNCYLCGGIKGATIKNDTIPAASNFINEQHNGTCQQYENNLLQNSSVGEYQCYSEQGKFFGGYMSQCCDGLPATYDCETNVRELVLEKFANGNEVVPPDPPSHNQNGETMLNVGVYLDVTHILDLDMKSNTLEILVALELIWQDPRVAWVNFIGQCSAVSYRASLDSEHAEIWVPDLDLIDQVEGADTLPESFASAFPDGTVWWRRTGVLKVACDIHGVKYFPFDSPTCNLDFGATRTPLSHRVHYKYSLENLDGVSIEFSDRLKNKPDYQEYSVEFDSSGQVTVESEFLSGFRNEFVRFHLVFKRATTYYIWGFVILYILFTYMAFGMFFLDVQVGERLGFGTGILFVIVAQDITIAEYTPITQKQLWVSQLSNSSKIFVIFGIIQTICILHYYYVNDLNGDGLDNSHRRHEQRIQESESLINTHNNCSSDGNGKEDDEISFQENELIPSRVEDVERRGASPTTAVARNNSTENNSSSLSIVSNTSETKDRQINRLDSNSLFLVRYLLGYKQVTAHESMLTQKVLKLRVIDRITAITFFFVYTIFLIVMFSLGITRAGED